MTGAPLAADRPHPGHIAPDGWSLALWVPAAIVAHIAGAAALTWIWSADAGIGGEAGFGGIAVDLVFDDGFGDPQGDPAAEAATADMPPTPALQAPDDTPLPVPFAEPEMPVLDQTNEVPADPVPEPDPAVAEVPEPPPPESTSPEPITVAAPTTIGTAVSQSAEIPPLATVEPAESLPPDPVAAAEPSDAEPVVATAAPWAPPPPQRPAVPASFVQRPAPPATPAPAPASPTPPAAEPAPEPVDAAATTPLGSEATAVAAGPAAGQSSGAEMASAPGDAGIDVDGARATYEQALLAWFDRHKTYPPTAQRRGIEGRVGVSVTIATDGSVTAFHLTSSSGSSLLDDAAQRMVVDASPVPPVPPALGGGPFSLPFFVQFALR